MILILTLFIIFAVFIAHAKNKTTKISKKRSEEFWQREREANVARKKDISSLPYITIPFDSLPFTETEDAELKQVQKQIKKLEGKKIINLTGYSNTELKLAYGAANLLLLSEYDHNFTQLTRTLYKWSLLLLEAGCSDAAKTVLTAGIQCGTDISGNYTSLAKIYTEEKRPDMIEELIALAENIQTVMKESTIAELRNILNDYFARN